MMDAFVLDGVLGELRPLIVGAHLGRVRAAGAQAVAFELSRPRRSRLWLDAGKGTAGLYHLTAEEARALEPLAAGEASGRTSQLVLLARKHLEGARVSAIRRVPGERVVAIETPTGWLFLRLSGAGPALTLVVDGQEVVSTGSPAGAWPEPPARPEREWPIADLDRILDDARASHEDPGAQRRALLAARPILGPALARALVRDGDTSALRRALDTPAPLLLARRAPEDLADRELAEPGAVTLSPALLSPAEGLPTRYPSWRDAAAAFLRARLRGMAFQAEQSRRLEGARRESRRLGRLLVRLEGDRAGLPDPDHLRHQGEALLAHAGTLPPGEEQVTLSDPRDASRTLAIRVDPRRSGPQNADVLFQKARRIERARVQIARRLGEAEQALAAARRDEAAVEEARSLSDWAGFRRAGVNPQAPRDGRRRPGGKGKTAPAGPRRFLTSRGLTVLVGRGARENHALTFSVAAPEDLWLHARDVVGAHVILRDPDRRAGPEDIREAAELAAFFSDGAGHRGLDVHVARRKHLRAGGAPGRVHVTHGETVRVRPRDPKGRLRER